MVTIRCPMCRNDLRFEDAAGGKPGKCPHCGALVAVPIAADKRSATARAMEEVLAAMDAKEKGGDPRRRGTRGPAAIELAARAPQASKASPKPIARKKLAITRPQWKIAAAVAAAIAIAIAAWTAFTPSEWESRQKDQILQLKQEADRLATDGKTNDAFKKYGSVVLATANRPIHDSELRSAVNEAREARVRLYPQVRKAEERAKTAAYIR